MERNKSEKLYKGNRVKLNKGTALHQFTDVLSTGHTMQPKLLPRGSQSSPFRSRQAPGRPAPLSRNRHVPHHRCAGVATRTARGHHGPGLV